jgi:hypothetical protein
VLGDCSRAEKGQVMQVVSFLQELMENGVPKLLPTIFLTTDNRINKKKLRKDLELPNLFRIFVASMFNY